MKWKECKKGILDYIKEESLLEGDLLLTDEEFKNRFHCSKAPIRKAMDELVKEGLLERKGGSKTKIKKNIDAQVSFSYSATRYHNTVESDLLYFDAKKMDKNDPVEKQVIDFFQISEEIPVVVIKRLRKLIEQNSEVVTPSSIQTVFLNPAFVNKDQISIFDLTKSLIKIYIGMQFADFKRIAKLKAILLQPEDMKHFGASQSVPILEKTQKMTASYKRQVIPFEFMYAIYRPDFPHDLVL